MAVCTISSGDSEKVYDWEEVASQIFSNLSDVGSEVVACMASRLISTDRV
jgi:hypothetical protein